jgi:hypothetical protein
MISQPHSTGADESGTAEPVVLVRLTIEPI